RHAAFERINSPTARLLVRAPTLSERHNHRACAVQLIGRNCARLFYCFERGGDRLRASPIERAKPSHVIAHVLAPTPVKAQEILTLIFERATQEMLIKHKESDEY